MTTVNTSGKIVIMTLELLESPELDYIHFWCINRGGSRISGFLERVFSCIMVWGSLF